MSFMAWVTTLLAILIASGNCIPVTEETGSNSKDEGEIVSSTELPTTEGNGFTLEYTDEEQNTTDETETEELEIEGSGASYKADDKYVKSSGETDNIQSDGVKNVVKKSYAENRGGGEDDDDDDHDDSDDDDDDDDDDDNDKKKRETSKYAFRPLKFLNGKMKRSYDPQGEKIHDYQSDNNEQTVSEDSGEDNEEIMEKEADFMQADYDYTIKNESESRKKRDSPGAESTVVRKRRQSGETVPYIKPNLSRRDIPVYPLYMVNTKENTSEREEEERERKNEAENDYEDED